MKRHAKIIIPLLALAAVVILNRPAPQSTIPEKLWGIWQTDDARYAERYLDISEAIFTIGQGGEKIKVFFVQRVENAPTGPQQRYTLHYRDHEEAQAPLQTFTFYYLQDEDGNRITLGRQPKIRWYRVNGHVMGSAEPRGAVP